MFKIKSMANKKIGITGHNGFLGSHLKNKIKYLFSGFDIINFKRSFFEDEKELSFFVNSCDIIIHLAGLNRHNSEEEILKINIQLAKALGTSLINNKFKGTLIFSSSLQEKKDTPYGVSKKKAAEIFVEASKSGSFSFTQLIIPNIFGPLCRPHYNSFISTFSHQLVNGEKPLIIEDRLVPLIYVENVVDKIIDSISLKGFHIIEIPHQIQIKVSDVLNRLKGFRNTYFEKGIIPRLNSLFDHQLFNSFRSYINSNDYFPKAYKIHDDERGYFSELLRTYSEGQVSFSKTKPEITRGNHFHTRKIERFSVIQGQAKIVMRTIGSKERIEFNLSGVEPAYVDIPVWTTHNIKNVGKEDLITVFWISEHYNPDDPDVFFEKV